jgi:putative DNA primase/helicase
MERPVNPKQSTSSGYWNSDQPRDPSYWTRCCAPHLGSALQAALHYASDHGWRVLPAEVGPAFRPLIRAWSTEATTALDTIKQWWTRWPDAAVCVATGPTSGVWVLDIDIKNGALGMDSLADLEGWFGGLEPEWIVRTPSGGRHYGFAHSPEDHVFNRVGLLPGVDVRGEGGLVVMPPSSKPEGAYEWLLSPASGLSAAPAGLLELIHGPHDERGPPTRKVVTARNRLARASYVTAIVTGELEQVRTALEGVRNHQLFKSAAAIGELVGAGLVPEDLAISELEAAGEKAGLEPMEIRRTVRSGLRTGAANPRHIEVAND